MFSKYALKEGEQMGAVTNVNMVGVEASVLMSRALDWAVEQCELISKDTDNLSDIGTRVCCSPSTNWVYGGLSGIRASVSWFF